MTWKVYEGEPASNWAQSHPINNKSVILQNLLEVNYTCCWLLARHDTYLEVICVQCFLLRRGNVLCHCAFRAEWEGEEEQGDLPCCWLWTPWWAGGTFVSEGRDVRQQEAAHHNVWGQQRGKLQRNSAQNKHGPNSTQWEFTHTKKKIVLECAQCLKALREVLSHVERFGVFSLGVILGKTENLHMCKKWERLTETAVNPSLEKHPPLSPSIVCCVCVELLWKQGSKKKLLWNKWLKRCWRDQFGRSYSCSFITTGWFSHWSAPMSVFCGSVSRFDANSVFSTWLK